MSDKCYFLNVGCADCIVLHLEDKVVMVDCHQGNKDDGEADIMDKIPNNVVDILILTHAHQDHLRIMTMKPHCKCYDFEKYRCFIHCISIKKTELMTKSASLQFKE